MMAMRDHLKAIADAVLYNSTQSPTVRSAEKIMDKADLEPHPASGDCALCKLQRGKGRKRCPEVQCGHITLGCNARSCKFCGHQFIMRDPDLEARPRKKRKTTVDVGVQCDLPTANKEPATVEYASMTPTYPALSQKPGALLSQ